MNPTTSSIGSATGAASWTAGSATGSWPAWALRLSPQQTTGPGELLVSAQYVVTAPATRT